jgi:hypothetical protein
VWLAGQLGLVLTGEETDVKEGLSDLPTQLVTEGAIKLWSGAFSSLLLNYATSPKMKSTKVWPKDWSWSENYLFLVQDEKRAYSSR